MCALLTFIVTCDDAMRILCSVLCVRSVCDRALPSAGKSSLLLRYTQNEFNVEYMPTIGMAQDIPNINRRRKSKQRSVEAGSSSGGDPSAAGSQDALTDGFCLFCFYVCVVVLSLARN